MAITVWASMRLAGSGEILIVYTVGTRGRVWEVWDGQGTGLDEGVTGVMMGDNGLDSDWPLFEPSASTLPP